MQEDVNYNFHSFFNFFIFHDNIYFAIQTTVGANKKGQNLIPTSNDLFRFF